VFDEIFEWIFHWLFFILYVVDMSNEHLSSRSEHQASRNLLQCWKTQSVQGSGQCHNVRSEGSTGSNQPWTQPERHKEDVPK